MADVWGGILGGALAAGGSIYNNERNIWMQQQTNAQNERLMREAWGREDTAVQRRAADMDAAGFNPVLAVGAPASSMPAVRAEAPEARENVGRSAVEGYRNAIDISMTEAQADLVRAQARKANAEADVMTGSYASDKGTKTWVEMQLEKVYGETLTSTLDAVIARAAYAAGLHESRAQVEAIKNKFYIEHGGELMEMEKELRAQGVAQEEIKKRLLERSEKWFTADKIMGYLGQLTGGFARVAGGAFMLDKIK